MTFTAAIKIWRIVFAIQTSKPWAGIILYHRADPLLSGHFGFVDARPGLLERVEDAAILREWTLG